MSVPCDFNLSKRRSSYNKSHIVSLYLPAQILQNNANSTNNTKTTAFFYIQDVFCVSQIHDWCGWRLAATEKHACITYWLQYLFTLSTSHMDARHHSLVNIPEIRYRFACITVNASFVGVEAKIRCPSERRLRADATSIIRSFAPGSTLKFSLLTRNSSKQRFEFPHKGSVFVIN